MDYEKRYKIGEVAKMLCVSIWTLRNWERLGRIKPKRNLGGQRYYTQEQVDELLGKEKS